MKLLEQDNRTSPEGVAGRREPTAAQFLKALGDEIRSPLNTLVETAELLADIPLAPEHVEFISALRDSADRLALLLGNILDLPELAIAERPADTRFELAQAIRDAIRTVSKQGAVKRLTLESKTGAEVPLFLSGDSSGLKRTLVELLRIAVCSSERGAVTLMVQANAEPDSGNLRFTVAYNGAAPAEDGLDCIGLSLAACRRRVHDMGGKLWAESEAGRGSRIRFTAGFEAATGHNETVPVALAGMRVLVADGDAASRMAVRHMLASVGAVATEAPSCASALYELQHSSYAAMVWNAGNAGAAGSDFLEQVRREDGGKKLAVVVTSPHFSAGEKSRYLEAGTESCLVRPLCKAELIEALRHERRRLEEMQAREPQPQPRTGPNRVCHILLVDGAPRNAAQAKGFLRDTPHQLEYAQDGASGLKKFQSHTYDLVLMDLHLQRVDGRQTALLMRSWEWENGLGRTPIVALAARPPDDADLFDGSIAKPIKKADFLEAVSQYGCGEAPASKMLEMPEPLRHLLPEFLTTQKAELETVRGALGRLDVRPARSFALNLMGSGPAFGFHQLASLGRKLESAGRRDDLKGVRHCLADIDLCLSGAPRKSSR